MKRRIETTELEISDKEILEIKFTWHDPSFDHEFGRERLPKQAELESFRLIGYDDKGEPVNITPDLEESDLQDLAKRAEKHLRDFTYEPGEEYAGD